MRVKLLPLLVILLAAKQIGGFNMLRKSRIPLLTASILVSGLLVNGIVSAKEIYVAKLTGEDAVTVQNIPIFDETGLPVGALPQAMPVTTGASGIVKLKINDDGNIEYTLKVDHDSLWRNIDGSPGTLGAAHIHLGPRGSIGPIMFNLYDARPIDQGGLGRPDGDPPFTGEFSGVLPPEDFFTAPFDYGENLPQTIAEYGVNSFEEALENIRRGNAYVSVHSLRHFLGEIRGQLRPIQKKYR